MSASAGTTEAGSSPSEAVPSDGEHAADLAGRIFRQLTVVPTLLAMAWLLAGLPLLLLGQFTPLLMLVISLPLAILLVTLGLRWIAGPSQGLPLGLNVPQFGEFPACARADRLEE